MIPAATRLGRRLGNQLYKVAFPLYQPLYSAFKSYADRAERQLLASRLSPGCIVVDAGANIGVYSRFLSKCVGATGLVHSFEPSSDNFARLRMASEDLPNVRVNQLAVSDETKESLLYVSDDLNVDHRTYPTKGELRRTESVRATRLDDYFRPGDRVDLVKMDIQGYELHALRGATRVLADNPELRLLIEFWPYGLHQAGSSSQALLAFLSDHHFETYLLKGNKLTKYDHPVETSLDPMSYHNLFAQRTQSRSGKPL